MEPLCYIRNIYRIIGKFEDQFQQNYDLGLNESFLLCELKDKELSSGEITGILEVTHSNASKVIRSLEKKKLIKRVMGKDDKRKMYFSLTSTGKSKLETIKCEAQNITEIAQNISTGNVSEEKN